MKEDLERNFCWGGFMEEFFISNIRGQATYQDVGAAL